MSKDLSPITYELRIQFVSEDADELIALKEQVRGFLLSRGEEAFVEGALDGLDILPVLDPPMAQDEHGQEVWDVHLKEEELEKLPFSIFKYSKPHLIAIKEALGEIFGEQLICAIHESATKDWLEGWKDGFKPFATQKFHVQPPWIKDIAVPATLLPLIIEPAMAFGTGQHATTRLCLEELELLADEKPPTPESQLWDLGTGTGILAIAAHKLGWRKILGTDIDPDAVLAAEANAKLNDVQLPVFQGGLLADSALPKGLAKHFDVLIANILFSTLSKLLPNIAERIPRGGQAIFSGLLTSDAEEFIRLAKAVGFVLEGRRQLDDWSCLRFVRF